MLPVKNTPRPDFDTEVLVPLKAAQAKEAAQAAAQAALAAQAQEQTAISANVPQIAPEQPTSASCAAYEPLVAAYTDWNVSIMMAIMQAESGCNPNAYNPSGCYGLFQVNGYGPLYDPAANVAAAHNKFLGNGYLPWTTYTSGIYLRYLQ